MHRLGVASAVAALTMLLAHTGQAQPVTYNTLNTQLCFGGFGCGTNQQTIGGANGINVRFEPIAASTVNPNPSTFGSLGDLIVSCAAGGTACGMQSLNGLNLFINIAQTAPTAGSATLLAGAISGNVSGTMSSASILWPNPNAVQIGQIRYAILNNPLGLVPPSTNGGLTSIQATITNTVIPEPSTFVLLAAGLVALFFLPRRRRGA
ncbi:MAG: PEP-CTERM sorting domain-containing protein [Gemmatimonadaceae bacterium]|nr:PEP-CTERM sorting domain-containing protein [Gemmatimonadaceae bacterium]